MSALRSKSQLLTDLSEGATSFPTLAANAELVAVACEAAQDGKPSLFFRLVEEGGNR